MNEQSKRLAVFVTNRRLDDMRSGSAVYLRTCMDAAIQAGYEARIVCIPETAIGNKVWCKVQSEFSDRAEILWPSTFKVGQTYVSTSPSVWGRFIWRLGVAGLSKLKMNLGGLTKVRSSLGVVPSISELQRTAKIVKDLKPEMVVVEYSSLGPLFSLLPDVKSKIVFHHDLFSHRAKTFKESGREPDHFELSFDEELARFKHANGFIYASRNELEAVKKQRPDAIHAWLRPMVTTRRDALKPRDEACAVYVGANHAGNRDALVHFLDEIWPLVLKDVPSARLKVVGDIGHATPSAATTANVDVLGRIPDLADLAGPDAIGIASTRLASGVSIKIAEYLALGMPVVSYPMGVDGFGSALDAAVLRADTPREYADHMIELFKSKEKRAQYAEAAFATAETELSHAGLDSLFVVN
ncbi:glycosyltransferase family 4 protein [Hirschia litorea]|uniref:Glycosyltransferase family 4 protein n=1 Tax=Hirschia litorea TaxID=1199156 RepID=A0ABW2IG30_9PROT